MMMAVATMLCICKHNDNDDADDGNGDDNLLQGIPDGHKLPLHCSQVPWGPNFVQNGDPMGTQF